MYICLHVCVCIYVIQMFTFRCVYSRHAYLSVFMHLCMWAYIYIYACIHICIYGCIYICVHRHALAYIMCMYMHKYTYFRQKYLCIQVCVHPYMYMYCIYATGMYIFRYIYRQTCVVDFFVQFLLNTFIRVMGLSTGRRFVLSAWNEVNAYCNYRMR